MRGSQVMHTPPRRSTAAAACAAARRAPPGWQAIHIIPMITTIVSITIGITITITITITSITRHARAAPRSVRCRRRCCGSCRASTATAPARCHLSDAGSANTPKVAEKPFDLWAIYGHFAGTPFIQPHLATFKVEWLHVFFTRLRGVIIILLLSLLLLLYILILYIHIYYNNIVI